MGGARVQHINSLLSDFSHKKSKPKKDLLDLLLFFDNCFSHVQCINTIDHLRSNPEYLHKS